MFVTTASALSILLSVAGACAWSKYFVSGKLTSFCFSIFCEKRAYSISAALSWLFLFFLQRNELFETLDIKKSTETVSDLDGHWSPGSVIFPLCFSIVKLEQKNVVFLLANETENKLHLAMLTNPIVLPKYWLVQLLRLSASPFSVRCPCSPSQLFWCDRKIIWPMNL